LAVDYLDLFAVLETKHVGNEHRSVNDVLVVNPKARQHSAGAHDPRELIGGDRTDSAGAYFDPAVFTAESCNAPFTCRGR
jgi:hypothetical protein